VEIISIGFGEFIAMALRAVSMLFGGGDGSGAMGVFALLAMTLGLVAAAGRMLIRAELEIIPLVLAVLAFYVMFVPKTTVTVVDAIDNRVEVVDNVPIGLAVAGAITTQTATYFSQAMQTVFYAGGDQPQLTAGYFAYPLRLLMTMRDLDRCDLGPTMCRNVHSYQRDCIEPLILSRQLDHEKIITPPTGATVADYYLNQADPLPFQGQFTEVANPGGHTYTSSCATAAQVLWDSFEFCPITADTHCGEMTRHLFSYVQRHLGQHGSSIPSNGGSPGVTPESITITAESIRENLQSLLPAIQHERDFLAAQIVSNIQAAGGSRYASETLWLTQTLESQRVRSAVEASGFLRISFFVMGLMQFIFIASTPIIAIIAIAKMAAGFKVYGSWILLGVWSGSFLVMVTIIDYWARRTVQVRFTEQFEASTTMNALSLPGLGGLYNHVADALTTANQFMTAAPLILLALLTSSIYPMAALAGRLAGGPEVGQPVGTTAAGERAAMIVNPNTSSYQHLDRAVADAGPAMDQQKIGLKSAMSRTLGDAQSQAASLQREESRLHQEMSQEARSIATTAQRDIASQESESEAVRHASALFDQIAQNEELSRALTDVQKAELMSSASMTTSAGFSASKFGFGAGHEHRLESRASNVDSTALSAALQSTLSSINQLANSGEVSTDTMRTLSERLASSDIGSMSEAASRASAQSQKVSETNSIVGTISEQLNQVSEAGVSASFGPSESSDAAQRREGNGVESIADITRNQAREIAGPHDAAQFLERLEANGAIPQSSQDSYGTHQSMMNLVDMAHNPDESLEHRNQALGLLKWFYGTDQGLESTDRPERPDEPHRDVGEVGRGWEAVGQDVSNLERPTALQSSFDSERSDIMGQGLNETLDNRFALLQATAVSNGELTTPDPVRVFNGVTHGEVVERAMAVDPHIGLALKEHMEREGLDENRGSLSGALAGGPMPSLIGMRNMARDMFREAHGHASEEIPQHAENEQLRRITAAGSGGAEVSLATDRLAEGYSAEDRVFYETATSGEWSHWRSIASNHEPGFRLENGGKGEFVPGNIQEVMDYVHDNYYDPLAYASQGRMMHSEHVNGAMWQAATMDQEQFERIQAGFKSGDGPRALEKELGLANPQENTEEAASQRAAGYARGTKESVERVGMTDNYRRR
jgi:hypothetical protein